MNEIFPAEQNRLFPVFCDSRVEKMPDDSVSVPEVESEKDPSAEFGDFIALFQRQYSAWVHCQQEK